MKSILVALQFLTPIPIKLKSVEPKDLARSMRYFPLIGLLIGLFLVLVKTLAFGPLNFSGMITATLMLLTLTALSGGLHLDGLSDMCDGFYAGRSREEIVKIMRDPHIGVMGVIGIFFILMIKWSVLASLPLSMLYYSNIALILVPFLGRWAMVIAAAAGPYAQAAIDGTAKPFVDNVTRKDAIISTVITLVVTLALSFISGNFVWVALMIVALLVVMAMVMISRKMLGGLTGDILGAVNEVTEVAVLFGAYLIYLLR
ncbi:MAG TPA: adenosylcobinamide-GDP ribazoletransferase [Planctomycetota bacterium]|nr:adenosylcobinamide-GDP ribazoletransferase [Planctomycetota bacterium]